MGPQCNFPRACFSGHELQHKAMCNSSRRSPERLHKTDVTPSSSIVREFQTLLVFFPFKKFCREPQNHNLEHVYLLTLNHLTLSFWCQKRASKYTECYYLFKWQGFKKIKNKLKISPNIQQVAPTMLHKICQLFERILCISKRLRDWK